MTWTPPYPGAERNRDVDGRFGRITGRGETRSWGFPSVQLAAGWYAEGCNAPFLRINGRFVAELSEALRVNGSQPGEREAINGVVDLELTPAACRSLAAGLLEAATLAEACTAPKGCWAPQPDDNGKCASDERIPAHCQE